MKTTIDWKVSATEARFIVRIAQRASKMAHKFGGSYAVLEADMDITACHKNGCPLLLEKLAETDDANFAHDVFGIRHHINRETGKLEDCFVPRFSI